MKFERFNQVEVVCLMDINRIISKIKDFNENQNEKIDYFFVDTRFHFLPKLDIRIVLQWHNKMDIELHVDDPNMEKCYSFHNITKIRGLLSTDCTGFGPEEYVLRDAIPGRYIIKAKAFHIPNPKDFNGSLCSLQVFVNWGSNDEYLMQNSFRIFRIKEEVIAGEIIVCF